MPTREYRLVVEGELSDSMGVVFEGMTLTREGGKTVLAGQVRDRTELHGLLQRVSSLGLTLLEATAVGRGGSEALRSERPDDRAHGQNLGFQRRVGPSPR